MRFKTLGVALLVALFSACMASHAGARLPPPDPEPAAWWPTPLQLRTARGVERDYESLGKALARRAGELHCLRYRYLAGARLLLSTDARARWCRLRVGGRLPSSKASVSDRLPRRLLAA
jgi:hypothetical protein